LRPQAGLVEPGQDRLEGVVLQLLEIADRDKLLDRAVGWQRRPPLGLRIQIMRRSNGVGCSKQHRTIEHSGGDNGSAAELLDPPIVDDAERGVGRDESGHHPIRYDELPGWSPLSVGVREGEIGQPGQLA